MIVHCPPDSVLQQCLIYKEELGRCQQVNPKFFRSKRPCKDLLIYRLRDLEITSSLQIVRKSFDVVSTTYNNSFGRKNMKL